MTVSAPARRPGIRLRRARDTATGWGLVGPATLIVLGLSIFPAVWAFLLSLQEWNGFSEPEWVGAGNYADMASDADLGAAVMHTLVYSAMFVPASVLLGLGLAVALNRRAIHPVLWFSSSCFLMIAKVIFNSNLSFFTFGGDNLTVIGL